MILTHAKAYVTEFVRELKKEKEYQINDDIADYYMQGLNDREITTRINKKHNTNFSEEIIHFRRVTSLIAS